MIANSASARAAGLTLWVAVALGLLGHALYITRAGADAVYMDSLRLLWQWFEVTQGRMSWLAFWGQHGSPHSGLLTQALLAGNTAWFGLDAQLANRMTGVVIAAVTLLLGQAYVADLRRAGGAHATALVVVVVLVLAGLCFSLSGFELLTLDMGLGLWLKNLLVFSLFLGHARTLRGESSLWQAAGLSVGGALLVVFCAMGWAYAVAGAVVAVQGLHHLAARQWPQPRQLLLPLTLMLTLLAVILLKRSVFGAAEESGASLQLDSLRQWLLALSSTFLNAEAVGRFGLPGMWLALLGGLLALGYVIASCVRLLDARGSRFPVLLIAYSALCAASFVLARGSNGDAAVMASRYHMDVFPGLIGVLWILSMPATGPLRAGKRAACVGVGGLALLVLLFQAAQMRLEWQAAPYRKAIFAAMNEALRAGVPDQAAADLLQAPLADARGAAALMRRHQLGVFAGARQLPIAALQACSSQWRLGSGWYPRESGGAWSATQATFEVPQCDCEYRVTLFVPAHFPERSVTVVDEQGPTLPVRVLTPGVGSELVLPAFPQARRYRLTSSRGTVPVREGLGQDARELGVYMGVPQMHCAAGR